LVLDGEGFAGVLGIGLECTEHFTLLFGVQLFCRDDSNLFFLVELLVQLLVLAGNLLDVDKALVFG